LNVDINIKPVSNEIAKPAVPKGNRGNLVRAALGVLRPSAITSAQVNKPRPAHDYGDVRYHDDLAAAFPGDPLQIGKSRGSFER